METPRSSCGAVVLVAHRGAAHNERTFAGNDRDDVRLGLVRFDGAVAFAADNHKRMVAPGSDPVDVRMACGQRRGIGPGSDSEALYIAKPSGSAAHKAAVGSRARIGNSFMRGMYRTGGALQCRQMLANAPRSEMILHHAS